MSSINGNSGSEGTQWVSAQPTGAPRKSTSPEATEKLKEIGPKVLGESEQTAHPVNSLAGRIIEVDKATYEGFKEQVRNKPLPKPPVSAPSTPWVKTETSQLKRSRETEETEVTETKRARVESGSETENVTSTKNIKRLSTSILDRTLNAFLSLFKTETAEAPPFDAEATQKEIEQLDSDIALFEGELTRNESTIDPRQLNLQRTFIEGLKATLQEKKSLLTAYRGAEDAKKMPKLMESYTEKPPLKSDGGIEAFIEKNPEGSPRFKILKNIQEQINQAYSFRNDMIRLGKLAQFIQEQPELTEAEKNTFQRGLPDVIEGAEKAAQAVKNLETTYFGTKIQSEYGRITDPNNPNPDETLTHFFNDLSSIFGNQGEIFKTFAEATSNYSQIVTLTTPLSNNSKMENFNERLAEYGKNIGIMNFSGIRELGAEYIKPAQRFMRIPMLLEEAAKNPAYKTDEMVRNIQNSRNAASDINRLRY